MLRQKLPRKIHPFVCHGTELRDTSGDEYHGDCAICRESSHFYVNGSTGQFSCKKCGAHGNAVSFLEQYWRSRLNETTRRDYQQLEQDRDIPWKAFKRHRLAWTSTDWILPCWTERQTVQDLRRWKPGTNKVLSTTGCHVMLFGLDKLMQHKGRPARIWLCEGEWDTIALSWALYCAGRSDQNVAIGVPGADVFKENWLTYFSGHKVRVCYDNDEAGDRGSARAGDMLSGCASHVEYLCWPDSRPKGWDLRDWFLDCRKNQIPENKALSRLARLVKPKHRRGGMESVAVVESSLVQERPTYLELPSSERPNFNELVTVYSRWLSMDVEMVNGLKIALAVILSEQLAKDPLWMYLVGPPASGKSTILLSTRSSDRVTFRSSLHPQMLVSGHPGTGKTDPSLLAIIAGKVLCIQDATALLRGNPAVRDEVYAMLRDAYDGEICRSYGHGLVREYSKLHFTVLIGVTHVINSFRGASLGDRFLKYVFRLSEEDLEARMWAAATATLSESNMETEITDAATRFLAQPLPTKLPFVPSKMIRRVLPLAKLIGWLRANVDYVGFGEATELAGPTEPEQGTRIVKQLKKLAVSLAIVEGKDTVDEDIWKLVERVAFDTAIQFHVDVIGAIASLDGKATVTAIQKSTGIPMQTLRRRLMDLEALDAIIRRKVEEVARGVGQPPLVFELAARMKGIMDRMLSDPIEAFRGTKFAPRRPATARVRRTKNEK